MRLWWIWAVLAVIWGLQGLLAALDHRPRAAVVMLGMTLLFAIVGNIVRRRTMSRVAGKTTPVRSQ